MKPGNYWGTVLDYGVVEGKTSPQVKVTFAIEDGTKFSWFGNLSNEKGQEITTRNLITLGATPANIDKVEQGVASGVLNVTKKFELVVADRVWKDKTYTEIKYINDPETAKKQAFVKGSGVLAALKGTAAQIFAAEGISAKPQTNNSPDVGF